MAFQYLFYNCIKTNCCASGITSVTEFSPIGIYSFPQLIQSQAEQLYSFPPRPQGPHTRAAAGPLPPPSPPFPALLPPGFSPAHLRARRSGRPSRQLGPRSGMGLREAAALPHRPGKVMAPSSLGVAAPSTSARPPSPTTRRGLTPRGPRSHLPAAAPPARGD